MESTKSVVTFDGGEVTLGFSDDLFCQIANSWPYLDVVDIDDPDGPLQQAVKPDFVLNDMEYMSFITHPTSAHVHELQLKGVVVLPGNVVSAQKVILDLVEHLGVAN